MDSASPENHNSAWLRVFKGKKESNLSWSLREGVRVAASLHGVWTSYDLSLDALLFTRFVSEITEGESGEEICSLLITYSLFLLL